MEMKYFDLIKPGTTHDFVKYRRIAVVVSLIVNALVLVGVIVWPGLNYGVDFGRHRAAGPLQEAGGARRDPRPRRPPGIRRAHRPALRQRGGEPVPHPG